MTPNASDAAEVENQVEQYEKPDDKQNHEFLRRLYFGYAEDPIDVILSRAYLDLSRTVHGMGKRKDGEKAGIRGKSRDKIKLFLSLVLSDKQITQEKFDSLHKDICEQLVKSYKLRENDSTEDAIFFIGHAQKWINMTLKYIFLYPDLAEKYEHTYPFCHMPIDQIILDRLRGEDLKNLLGPYDAWSRIKDYDTYLQCQRKIREHFEGFAPLAVEFKLWQTPPSKPTDPTVSPGALKR